MRCGCLQYSTRLTLCPFLIMEIRNKLQVEVPDLFAHTQSLLKVWPLPCPSLSCHLPGWRHWGSVCLHFAVINVDLLSTVNLSLFSLPCSQCFHPLPPSPNLAIMIQLWLCSLTQPWPGTVCLPHTGLLLSKPFFYLFSSTYQAVPLSILTCSSYFSLKGNKAKLIACPSFLPCLCYLTTTKLCN